MSAKPSDKKTSRSSVRLFSKIANIKIQKLNIEDAIVEANGEPKIDKKFVNGTRMNVIEVSYLVTPLKAGSLKIPAIAIQGGIQVRRKPHMGSLFDDDDFDFGFEPFFMMSDQLKPFTLTTDEIVLNVQAPVAGINPWLPAKSLKIEETWNDSQTLKVGEPIIRSFNIAAEGIMSSQLPGLNDLQASDSNYKVYADKPEMKDDVKNGVVQSFRKEQYTLIPQKPGALTLPEISVAWWDVSRKEKVVARIPSRTLQILPSAETAQSKIETAEENKYVDPAAQVAVVQRDPILYALVGGMALLLLLAILWALPYRKKSRALPKSLWR